MAEAHPGPIRVFVIDDHVVVRDALRLIIADELDIEIVGEAGTAAEALEDARRLQPDVILLDLHTPDRDGIELLHALRGQLPAAKLVVVTAYDDEHRVAEALRAGADGYLVKTARREDLMDGVRRARAGETPLSDQIMGAALRAMRKPPELADAGLRSLTARERQVLRLLAAGVSTGDTAARLTISPKTVHTHRQRICRKLGCKNAVELTRIAVRAGIVEP